jgi:Tfp pilus assembly protein PilF
VYEGVRYLAQLESKLALQELAQVENSRFSQVKIQTEWYIALAYLQQNDLKNCKEQLKKVIANPENTYSRQAMELLGKIQ